MGTETKTVAVRTCDRCGRRISRKKEVDKIAAMVFSALSSRSVAVEDNDAPDLCSPCERSITGLAQRILKPSVRKG